IIDALQIHTDSTNPSATSSYGSALAVNSIAISPDSRELAAGCENGVVVVWTLPDAHVLKTLEGFTKPVQSLAFAPDGKSLAVVSGDFRDQFSSGEVVIWSTTNWAEIVRVGEQQGPYFSVAFSPDGSQLAVAGGMTKQPAVVRIYDLKSQKERPVPV